MATAKLVGVKVAPLCHYIVCAVCPSGDLWHLASLSLNQLPVAFWKEDISDLVADISDLVADYCNQLAG